MTDTNRISNKSGLQNALQAKSALAEDTKKALLASADALTDAAAKTKFFSYLSRLFFLSGFAKPKLGGIDFPLTADFTFQGIGISYQGRRIGFLRGEKMTDDSYKFHYWFGSPHFNNKVEVADLAKWEEAIKTNSAPELLSAFLAEKLSTAFRHASALIVYGEHSYQVTIKDGRLTVFPYGHPNIKHEIDLGQNSDVLTSISTKGISGIATELTELKNRLPKGASTTPTYFSRASRYSRHSTGRAVQHHPVSALDDLLPPPAATAPPVKPPIVAAQAAAPNAFADQPDVLPERPLRPLAPSRLIPLGREPEVKIELTRPYRPKVRVGRAETPPPTPATRPLRPTSPPLKPIIGAESAADMYLDIFNQGLLEDKTLGARRILDFKVERPEDAQWDYAYRSLITYLATFGHRETLSGAMKEARHYRCLITKNHDLFFYRSLDEQRVICHLYRQNQSRHRDELPLTVTFARNVPELAANIAAALKTRSAAEMRQKNGKKLQR